MRTPYVLQEAEVQTLLHGIINHGPKETYDKMKEKAITAMSNDVYVDEMFLDMYETILKRARELHQNEKDSDEGELQLVLYQLSSMLRTIAHDVYRMYIKKGKNKNSPKFLRLISFNKDILARIWQE